MASSETYFKPSVNRRDWVLELHLIVAASQMSQGIHYKSLALIDSIEPMVAREKTEQISGGTINMEATIGSIYFTTTSTVSFNSSEITTNPTDDNDIFKWTSEEIARLIQIVVRPTLVVFGSVGNILTFIL